MAGQASLSDYGINSANNDRDYEQNAMFQGLEQPLGNLSNYAAKPVDYDGKVRKGILIFDADFESGNLGRVDAITGFEYDLFVRPDTCNSRLSSCLFHLSLSAKTIDNLCLLIQK